MKIAVRDEDGTVSGAEATNNFSEAVSVEALAAVPVSVSLVLRRLNRFNQRRSGWRDGEKRPAEFDPGAFCPNPEATQSPAPAEPLEGEAGGGESRGNSGSARIRTHVHGGPDFRCRSG
jgi:hypothetical protein